VTNVDEFLEHHGVKGMRWGVQNVRDTAASIGRKLKSPAATTAKKLAKPVVGIAATGIGAAWVAKKMKLPVSTQFAFEAGAMASGYHYVNKFLKDNQGTHTKELGPLTLSTTVER
jgi:hypothetical protein